MLQDRNLPEGADGVFGDESLSSYSSSGRSGLQQRDISEMPGAEAEWFSAPQGEDFSSMPVERIEFLKPHLVNEEDYYETMPVLNLEDRPPMGRLMDIVGVKTHRSGNIEAFDCENSFFAPGEEVIVETDRGLAIGEVKVATSRRYINRENIPRVFRIASRDDMRQRDRNQQRAAEAFSMCQHAIARMRLHMKLVEVVFLHGGNKAIFYFMAETRVDFRNLVRDLAHDLHIRVEMRQIGVRDAARMIGGIGGCGHPLCCTLYIREFHPVSIRMAKDQDLVLNPEKVSGQCGRLLCCLAYEEEVYREKSKGMPKVGKLVETPDGMGRVKDRDILRSFVRVHLEGDTGLKTYPITDIRPVTPPQGGNRNDGRPPRERAPERSPAPDRLPAPEGNPESGPASREE